MEVKVIRNDNDNIVSVTLTDYPSRNIHTNIIFANDSKARHNWYSTLICTMIDGHAHEIASEYGYEEWDKEWSDQDFVDLVKDLVDGFSLQEAIDDQISIRNDVLRELRDVEAEISLLTSLME